MKVLTTNIPIKKSKDDMELYLEYGELFNKVLIELKDTVENNTKILSEDIQKAFESSCNKHFVKTSSKQKYYSFPFIKQKNYIDEYFGHPICISLDSDIAHGKPKGYIVEDQVIKIDCGIAISNNNGKRLHLDAAFTTIVNNKPHRGHWVYAAKAALSKITIENPQDTYIISKIIQDTAKNSMLKQVVSLTGHGIGYTLHESPVIHNATADFKPVKLFNGLCFCAEPIFVKPDNKDSSFIAPTYIKDDGWTISTTSGEVSSHFETTFGVIDGQIIDLIGITSW